MATGIIKYWNGESGWIAQDGVANIPTIYANDVMILAADIVSGSPADGAAVSYTIDTTTDQPWRALACTVS